MSIEDIPRVLTLMDEVVRRGKDVQRRHPDDRWIRTAIRDWTKALARVRTALANRDPREVANGLFEVFATDTRVRDSGAPIEFVTYMREDPTPTQASQLAADAWSEIRDEDGRPIDTPEMRARLQSISEMVDRGTEE